MTEERTRKVARFLELHTSNPPLLLPNPWDAGSARVLESAGFEALATTSSGFAGTLARQDGAVTAAESLTHAAELCAATRLPVSADLENGFGDSPEAVAETMRQAASSGLAGCSVEDFTRREEDPIYAFDAAVARIAAAADVARASATRLVLTARAENYLHGRPDLDDTLKRLAAFADAGADCVYAPGLVDLADIERAVAATSAALNVLLRPNGPTVAELASVGVARISVGGAFYQATLTALAEAAHEFANGQRGFLERSSRGNEWLARFDPPA